MNTKAENTKTKVFNVIILDKSGSMERIRTAAVDGFNETLAGIKNAQERYADTQEHYVTLLTFCSCKMRFVMNIIPANEAIPLTREDYSPCCSTPLYDATGLTLSYMQEQVKGLEDYVVVVTIITDGLENASKVYDNESLKRLIEKLKEEGWTFTYMGANQNSKEAASNISIRNSCDFIAIPSGITLAMFHDRQSRMNFFSLLDEMKESERSEGQKISKKERQTLYTAMADKAFDNTVDN